MGFLFLKKRKTCFFNPKNTFLTKKTKNQVVRFFEKTWIFLNPG